MEDTHVRVAALLLASALSSCTSYYGVMIDDSQLEGEVVVDVTTVRFDNDVEPAPYDPWPGLDPDDAEAELVSPRVSLIVLHATRTETVDEAYRAMVERGSSTHFFIDADGTVYQALDLAYAARHTTGWDRESISIHLVNPLPDLAAGEEIDHDWVEAGWNPVLPATINGAVRNSLGYTPSQYEALIALLRDLDRHFPGLATQVPLRTDGQVVDRVLALSPEDGGAPFRGVVGHWHLDASEWDPGPGLDWARLQAGISR